MVPRIDEAHLSLRKAEEIVETLEKETFSDRTQVTDDDYLCMKLKHERIALLFGILTEYLDDAEKILREELERGCRK